MTEEKIHITKVLIDLQNQIQALSDENERLQKKINEMKSLFPVADEDRVFVKGQL